MPRRRARTVEDGSKIEELTKLSAGYISEARAVVPHPDLSKAVVCHSAMQYARREGLKPSHCESSSRPRPRTCRKPVAVGATTWQCLLERSAGATGAASAALLTVAAIAGGVLGSPARRGVAFRFPHAVYANLAPGGSEPGLFRPAEINDGEQQP